MVNNEMQANLTMKHHLEESGFCHCDKCTLNHESPSQLFEARFKAIENDIDKNEDDEYSKVFSILESNIIRLFNERVAPSIDIEHKLLQRANLNIPMCESMRMENIYRCLPIAWEEFHFLDIKYLKMPGDKKFFNETADWTSRDDHWIHTRIYNRLLINTLRGAFLVKSNLICEKLSGFYKSPFQEPTNNHVRKFASKFSSQQWLRKGNIDWIENIDCSLAEWATSVFKDDLMELQSTRGWLNKSIMTYKSKLQLHDNDYWVRERGEQYTYITHLKRYAELHRLNASSKERMINRLQNELIRLVGDFAGLLESIIEK